MATFNDYLFSKGHSSASVEAERRQLGYFMTWCDVEGMEPEEAGYRDLLAYVQSLRKKGTVKPITLQKYMGTLRHFFAWQVKTGKRDDNPAIDIDIQDIQRKVLQVMLSRQELERIYQQYGSGEASEANKEQNWFKASQACHEAEQGDPGAVGVPRLDQSRDRGANTEELGATRRQGACGRRPAAQRAVVDLGSRADHGPDGVHLADQAGTVEAHGKTAVRLFVSVGAGSKLNNTLNKLLEQITRIEPKVKTLQQLRASVITHWIKTLNLREAQHRAGHRYVSSTEAYLINDLEGFTQDVGQVPSHRVVQGDRGRRAVLP